MHPIKHENLQGKMHVSLQEPSENAQQTTQSTTAQTTSVSTPKSALCKPGLVTPAGDKASPLFDARCVLRNKVAGQKLLTNRPISDSKHPRRAHLPYRFRSAAAVYVQSRSSSTNSEYFNDDSSRASGPENPDDSNHEERTGQDSRGRSEQTPREESILAPQTQQSPEVFRDDPVRIAGGAAIAVFLVALGGVLASVGVQWMMDEWTGSDGPFVVVPGSGTLRGSRGITERGTHYFSFMGIPYATPPLENARFRPPLPLPPSCGLRDARYEGTVCPQPPSSDYVSYTWRLPTLHQVLSWVMLLPRLLLLGVRGILQEEDCLTINVHTTLLGQTNHSAAVLVWVHGGGFFIGDGNRDEYGPDFFIEEGLIFVSFNYRLGVLGFLSLCTSRAPGNAGLKDQLAALKWVRKHIASFGGDPTRVTLWGESAGAVAVHILTLSPGRNKLPVRNAIISSGVALAGWALEREPRRRAAALATALGWKGAIPSASSKSCNGSPNTSPSDPVSNALDNEALLQFLLRQPAHQLVRHMKDVVADDLTGAEQLAWVPCVEPPMAPEDTGEDSRVLIADPALLLEDGAVAKIPIIMGVNSHEGMVWLAGKTDAVVRRHLLRIQRQMVTLVVPDIPLLVERPTSNQSLLAAERIRHFYFGRKAINVNTLPEFIDMYSDILFVVPFMESVALHLRAATAPLYLYRFSFEGRLNFCKRIISVSLPGASHADELGYLFHISILPTVEITRSSPEDIMRARIVRLWSNFVKTGNPTPFKDPLLDNVIWEPASPGNIVFLEIGEVLVMQKKMFEERLDFWRDLYHEIFLRKVHW